MQAHANSFDLIVNTVAAPHNLDAYISLLKREGVMVLVGAPSSPHPSPGVFNLILKRRSIAGSLIGGIPETQEMLDFCAEKGITSDIEMIAMQDRSKRLTTDAQKRRQIPLRHRHGDAEAGLTRCGNGEGMRDAHRRVEHWTIFRPCWRSTITMSSIPRLTFDLEPRTLGQRQQWLDGFAATGRYQCFVAAKDGRAIGWAASLRYRDRAAYDTSVETSVYVAPAHRGRGWAGGSTPPCSNP